MRKLTPEQMTELENTPWDQKPECVWNSFDYVQASVAEDTQRQYLESLTPEEKTRRQNLLAKLKTFGD